ncbi:MAG: phosphatase PAP2 family protein [Bacteroidota bacterium]
MKRFAYLHSFDFVSIGFLSILTAVELIYFPILDRALPFIIGNIAICTAVILCARYTATTERPNYYIRLFRDLYLFPSVLFIYTQASSISHPIHGHDFDATLIMLDRMIFGTDPTHWIYRFAHPIFTEILQLAYSSYYFFYFALFYELYQRSDKREYQYGMMIVAYAFYLSYVGYLLVPAIGPRFTLHNFITTDAELPGLFLTEYLRAIINSGGGIPAGALDPTMYVNRDTFPSGHTEATLAAMYLAFALNTRIRWFLLVIGTLLIISTVYLRYHYVVDVIAGVIFFLFAVWSGKKIDRWWNNGIKNV